MFHHNFSIEVYNMDENRWETAEHARTLDEAFDIAEKYIGFNKSYDTVAILNIYDHIVWESDKPLPKK